MEDAVRAGLASAADLAYLTDRVLMRRGEPQLTATQSFGRAAEDARLWPVAEPATVNVRRMALGLPPLAADVLAEAWTIDEIRAGDIRFER